MEEDIKVLEEFIEISKGIKESENNVFIENVVIKKEQYLELLQAIENLIKRYKELEQLNLTEIKTYSDGKIIEKRISLDDYIPKSKVRELQDKYKNKIEKLESKKIWNEPVDTINNNRYTNYFNAYEELLQEGDK